MWKSQDELFLNEAFVNQSGGKHERRESTTKFAGALKCCVGNLSSWHLQRLCNELLHSASWSL